MHSLPLPLPSHFQYLCVTIFQVSLIAFDYVMRLVSLPLHLPFSLAFLFQIAGVAPCADAVALMPIAVRALSVRLAAVLAAVRPLREVHPHVVHCIAQLSEHFAAESAGETLSLSG